MAKEVEVARGCVLGCRLQTSVFCEGSCASVVAPELRPHRCGTARWRGRLMCAVCMAEEAVVVLNNHLLAVCWKMEAVSKSCGGVRAPCWASGEGASLCSELIRNVL